MYVLFTNKDCWCVLIYFKEFGYCGLNGLCSTCCLRNKKSGIPTFCVCYIDDQPDEPFYNYRATQFVDRLILCFKAPKIGKGLAGNRSDNQYWLFHQVSSKVYRSPFSQKWARHLKKSIMLIDSTAGLQFFLSSPNGSFWKKFLFDTTQNRSYRTINRC